jgi:hypothetical protein
LEVLKGKAKNSVFRKLQQNFEHGMIGVVCAGRIFHNTVRAATNIFPVDVEMIISKYICT